MIYDHPGGAARKPSDLLERRSRIREALRRAMVPGNDSLWSDAQFARLALKIFGYQVDANPLYGSFVRGRGLEPGDLRDWRSIPAVPTTAFKELPLRGRDTRPVEVTFRTSGTAGAAAGRGVHDIRDLSIYRESLLTTATHYLGPALTNRGHNKNRIRILCVTPSPEQKPDSSLIHMLRAWIEKWDDGGGGFLADSKWQIATTAVRDAIERSRNDETRVLMAGTAFGFMHLSESISEGGPAPLPPGSVVVETGGFKGRSRTISRGELYATIAEMFRVSKARIVSEYGMTELLSQFYEPVLLEDGPEDPGTRRHLGPPWVRTRILNPHTLEPVSAGKRGILCHLDLANLDSVMAILTDDLGVAVGDGFRILGRAEDAEPRGCSMMMEELLRASHRAAEG